MPDPTNRKDLILAAIKAVRPDLDTSTITNTTSLIHDLGCASIDGVCLALELEDALGVVVPYDQNPLIWEANGRKGARSLAEVIAWTETLAPQAAAEGVTR